VKVVGEERLIELTLMIKGNVSRMETMERKRLGIRG